MPPVLGLGLESALVVADETFCKGCDDWTQDVTVCGECGEGVCPEHRTPGSHSCRKELKR
jgi:hypothetical protein